MIRLALPSVDADHPMIWPYRAAGAECQEGSQAFSLSRAARHPPHVPGLFSWLSPSRPSMLHLAIPPTVSLRLCRQQTCFRDTGTATKIRPEAWPTSKAEALIGMSSRPSVEGGQIGSSSTGRSRWPQRSSARVAFGLLSWQAAVPADSRASPSAKRKVGNLRAFPCRALELENPTSSFLRAIPTPARRHFPDLKVTLDRATRLLSMHPGKCWKADLCRGTIVTNGKAQ